MNILGVIVLFTALLCSHKSLAIGLPLIDIQELNGRYTHPSGSATAKYWNVPKSPPLQNAKFTVFQEQDLFVFEGDAGLYELKGLPDSIVKMNSLNWKGSSFKSDASGLNLNIDSLTGSDESGLLLIKKFNFSCKGNSSRAESRDALFDVCLKSSQLKTVLYDIYQTDRSNTRTTLENLEMTIKNGKFNLNVRAKFDITANIKANGKISFSKTISGAELRIRLDKAKASFLTVTKKVFEAIEKEAAEGVRVERPYIIIDLE
ncbi:MAG: hypothetical protein ACJAT2_003492 [Bacteriovoracaceae bacterium]|jgi:hypothetical protein